MAPRAWWNRVCSAPGLYVRGHAQLTDAPQPLKPGMFNQIEKQIRRYRDEPVYRIVHDFSFVAKSLTHGFQVSL